MTLTALREKLAARIKHREHERAREKKARQRLRESGKGVGRDRKAIGRLRELIKKVLTKTPPQVMFDSVDVSQIPSDAKAVAGYVGGNWPTYGTLVARFPRAKKLSIAISASEDAECLDCEPGDATVAQVPAWVKRQKARGVKRPVVYGSASTMQQILNALGAAGISRSEVRIWTAHYGAGKHICGPFSCRYLTTYVADGTQWTDTSRGRNLDESYLSKDFFA